MSHAGRATSQLYHAASEMLRAEHDHPEIVVSWDPQRVSAAAASHMLELLCDLVGEGSRFEVGDTIQWGQRALHVVAGEQVGRPDAVAIFEPDLAIGPEDREVDRARLLPGATFTLLCWRAQRAVADSFDVDYRMALVPSQRDELEHCPRIHQASALVLMRGQEPVDESSGWFVGCRDDDCDHRRERAVASVWQVTRRHPGVIPFLGLPVGCLAHLGADGSVAACDGDDQDRPIANGSYLARHGWRSPFDLPDILD